MAITIETRDFVLTHGKEPRGFGQWAFRVGGETIFTPGMTYAEARKWIKARVAATVGTKGTITVHVCP